MCRLFGFRSADHASVHDALVKERNALRVQSVEHRDGWGIAHYDQDGTPHVKRGLGPALESADFEGTSRELRAQTVVAHLRLASVGAVDLCNVHPFVQGKWVFAHNGTLREFERHRAVLEEKIHPSLRERFQSRTDSERAFFLFLTHLGAPSTPSPATPSAPDVARALAQTLLEISRLTDSAEQRSGLNFLVTDGRTLLATRREKTLFFSARSATSRTASRAPEHGEPLQQLVLASEQLNVREPWFTVPPDEIVGVDADLTFQRWPLTALL